MQMEGVTGERAEKCLWEKQSGAGQVQVAREEKTGVSILTEQQPGAKIIKLKERGCEKFKTR